MPNPLERLGYVKCYSSGMLHQVLQLRCSRPINKSPSNSIRCNCQKICSQLRRPEIVLEIRKNVAFLEVTNKPIMYKSYIDFTNHRKKTNRAAVLSSRPLLNTGTKQIRPFNNLELRFLQIHIEECSQYL